jgi:hypothetical protein
MEQPTVTFKLFKSTGDNVELVDRTEFLAKNSEEVHNMLELIINNTRNWRAEPETFINLVIRDEEEYLVISRFREYRDKKNRELCEGIINNMDDSNKPNELKKVESNNNFKMLMNNIRNEDEDNHKQKKKKKHFLKFI